MPKISIITACYNHGKYISEMLDSVFAQTFQDFELIIVNNGSTDDTARILDQIQHEKVRIIHTENNGPAHARNLAISKSTGEIILNLDADNKIAPAFIAKCLRVFDDKPNAGIVYSELEFFGAKTGLFTLPDFSMEEMLRANCIDGNACFRKSDWARTEGYSPAMIYGYEDFEFWLSILELEREVIKIKEPLVFYRTYENWNDCRSGQRRLDPLKMEVAIIQAFQQHKKLYQTVPHIYKEFLNMENQFRLVNHPLFMNPEYPVFSIITPANNRPLLLKRAIESVINQSFLNWEQIIVDDANDSETAELVAKINDPRLKYLIHKTPKGAAGAYKAPVASLATSSTISREAIRRGEEAASASPGSSARTVVGPIPVNTTLSTRRATPSGFPSRPELR